MLVRILGPLFRSSRSKGSRIPGLYHSLSCKNRQRELCSQERKHTNVLKKLGMSWSYRCLFQEKPTSFPGGVHIASSEGDEEVR